VDAVGGTPTALVTRPVQSFAVDARSLYWTNADPGCPVDGGPCTPNAKVMKMPLGGGIATTLASESLESATDWAGEIAVDATSVYWIKHGSGFTLGPTLAVRKVPLDGGTVTTLASESWVVGGGAIFIDATNVYWSEAIVDPFHQGPLCDLGRVVKAPLAGLCQAGVCQ
jgi:hypothetical protein